MTSSPSSSPSSKKVAALIPAAGTGIRLGRGHKALVEINGESLLKRSVRAFENQVDEIIVAVSPEMCEEVKTQLGERAKLVLGGETRQASVRNLLDATDADLVLIHDAARPFLSARVIQEVIREVERVGAASVVVNVADTLIQAETGKRVDRQKLRAVQTPQGFKREVIIKAHKNALAKHIEATDDAGLVRLLGHRVALVEGSQWLMKVTTPADLEIATALAAVWDAQHD